LRNYERHGREKIKSQLKHKRPTHDQEGANVKIGFQQKDWSEPSYKIVGYDRGQMCRIERQRCQAHPNEDRQCSPIGWIYSQETLGCEMKPRFLGSAPFRETLCNAPAADGKEHMYAKPSPAAESLKSLKHAGQTVLWKRIKAVVN
jgi:hypothetical protein